MQFEWLIGLGIMNIVILIVLFLVVNLIIQGFFLGIGLGFVNGQNRDLGTTFVTALLMSLVSWIPCLGCFIAWYFIKSRHEVGWGSALIAWLLGGIISFLVFIALMIFVFGTLWAAFLAGLLPAMPWP